MKTRSSWVSEAGGEGFCLRPLPLELRVPNSQKILISKQTYHPLCKVRSTNELLSNQPTFRARVISSPAGTIARFCLDRGGGPGVWQGEATGRVCGQNNRRL